MQTGSGRMLTKFRATDRDPSRRTTGSQNPLRRAVRHFGGEIEKQL